MGSSWPCMLVIQTLLSIWRKQQLQQCALKVTRMTSITGFIWHRVSLLQKIMKKLWLFGILDFRTFWCYFTFAKKKSHLGTFHTEQLLFIFSANPLNGNTSYSSAKTSYFAILDSADFLLECYSKNTRQGTTEAFWDVNIFYAPHLDKLSPNKEKCKQCDW